MAVLRQSIAFALALLGASAFAIDASDRYRSPRNPERPIRRSTELIVLHTTEAAAFGSLKKLSERGECHYCVTEAGEVYRIVDRDREAFHAGRSMWNGKEDVDKFSIGIECVGYHDKSMPLVQLNTIRDLVKELQSMYHLSDDKVVCHAHVAYGAPNKWHKKKHRGRKQCGMLFAMPSVRRILELRTRVAYDPDTRAKRLVVGDSYLEKVLYGNVDTMRNAYGKGAVAAVPPSTENNILGWLGLGTQFAGAGKRQPAAPAAKGSDKPSSSAAAASPPKSAQKPAATKPVAAISAKPAAKPAQTRQYKRPPTSIAELRQQGYKQLGTISPYNTASRIAGGKWNSANTYYTIRNKVIPGNLIDPAHIEKGMGVWIK